MIAIYPAAASTNVAQESGGNLALERAAVQQLLDIQSQVLAVLQAINLQLALISGGDKVDPSLFIDGQSQGSLQN